MKLPEHNSEPLEVAATHFIGVQWKRCELTKKTFTETDDYMDQLKWDTEIEKLWYGMNALQKLMVGTTGRMHFCIALGNEMQKIANYIEMTTGYNPIAGRPEEHRHHLCLKEY